MRKIKLTINNVDFIAELYDSPTADKIYELLPIAAQGSLWGDEIYFSIPLTIEEEANAHQEIEVGELGFWPVGSAFCIFFGPTPVSTNEKPKAYSPVNVFGKITDDTSPLKQYESGCEVRVEIL